MHPPPRESKMFDPLGQSLYVTSEINTRVEVVVVVKFFKRLSTGKNWKLCLKGDKNCQYRQDRIYTRDHERQCHLRHYCKKLVRRSSEKARGPRASPPTIGPSDKRCRSRNVGPFYFRWVSQIKPDHVPSHPFSRK